MDCGSSSSSVPSVSSSLPRTVHKSSTLPPPDPLHPMPNIIRKKEHHDVILEVGEIVKRHPGNIILSNLIVNRRSGYINIHATNNNAKNEYLIGIYKEITITGGRFLRHHHDSDGLTDGYTLATNKFVYQCLRRRLRRTKTTKIMTVPQHISPVDPTPVMAVNDCVKAEEEVDG